MHGTCDRYGLAQTTSPAASEAYNRGVDALLKVQAGGLEAVAESIAHDPTFALGHAALALLGYEYCKAVDVEARMTAATMHARRATERERRHVHAVGAHIKGDSAPLISHLRDYPQDALLLSVAVPTIAFSGVTTVPEESWAIVERARPAYGSDWWFCGLLAFIRQEQRQWDEAMRLSCASLEVEPAAGHSVHARTHVHYETGDHRSGRDWIDGWIEGPGRSADNLAHYSWHAALHELSMGDFAAVQSRYAAQLSPPAVFGCRALVDSCSLLWRWAITPGAVSVPGVESVVDSIDEDLLDKPPTPFMALHAAVTLCALGQSERLTRLERWAQDHRDPTYAAVVSPLAAALRALCENDPSVAADRLQDLLGSIWRLGGSEAQREIVEDTLIAALLAAARIEEARTLIDRRLDRRVCRRDLAFLAAATLSP
ncbi:MAG TPA: pyridine nucleotide-disulfide oxidoreductase [Nocardioidaceae bacterium]|nr:pyridine nucleotide-disulfide oxidoreductase [Nocardioidaceae bacterium]